MTTYRRRQNIDPKKNDIKIYRKGVLFLLKNSLVGTPLKSNLSNRRLHP